MKGWFMGYPVLRKCIISWVKSQTSLLLLPLVSSQRKSEEVRMLVVLRDYTSLMAVDHVCLSDLYALEFSTKNNTKADYLLKSF